MKKNIKKLNVENLEKASGGTNQQPIEITYKGKRLLVGPTEYKNIMALKRKNKDFS